MADQLTEEQIAEFQEVRASRPAVPARHQSTRPPTHRPTQVLPDNAACAIRPMPHPQAQPLHPLPAHCFVVRRLTPLALAHAV